MSPRRAESTPKIRKTITAPAIAPDSGREKNRRSGLTRRSRSPSAVVVAAVMTSPPSSEWSERGVGKLPAPRDIA